MTDAPPRSLEYVPLDTVKPARWNPKSHEAQLIADSIEEHGFVTPMVLDDRTGELVAGHGRRDDLLTRRASGAEPPEGIVVDDEAAGRPAPTATAERPGGARPARGPGVAGR